MCEWLVWGPWVLLVGLCRGTYPCIRDQLQSKREVKEKGGKEKINIKA
jgi:hypothetical protein